MICGEGALGGIVHEGVAVSPLAKQSQSRGSYLLCVGCAGLSRRNRIWGGTGSRGGRKCLECCIVLHSVAPAVGLWAWLHRFHNTTPICRGRAVGWWRGLHVADSLGEPSGRISRCGCDRVRGGVCRQYGRYPIRCRSKLLGVQYSACACCGAALGFWLARSSYP